MSEVHNAREAEYMAALVRSLEAEVERLRTPALDLLGQVGQLSDEITRLRAQNAELVAALRDAYEVYAGSDGFIPETAAEGYQQQIIKQMVGCISAAIAKAESGT